MKHHDKQEIRLEHRRQKAKEEGGVDPKEGRKLPGSMNRHKSTSIKEARKGK